MSPARNPAIFINIFKDIIRFLSPANAPAGTYYAKVSGGGSPVKDYALIWSLAGSGYNNISSNISRGSALASPGAYETAQKLMGSLA